jgi:hypothetical protein
MAHPPDGVDAPTGDPATFSQRNLIGNTPTTHAAGTPDVFADVPGAWTPSMVVRHMHNPGDHSDSYALSYSRAVGSDTRRFFLSEVHLSTAIPEPSAFVLTGIGLLGLFGYMQILKKRPPISPKLRPIDRC